MSGTYRKLMEQAAPGDAFDLHILACILAKGLSEGVPLTHAVGLTGAELRALAAQYFPLSPWLLANITEDRGEDSIEEPDFRQLLVAGATETGSELAGWLAAMVVRRSLKTDHLWQDLGLTARTDLSGLLLKHFNPLAVKNDRDMKWKKFFYRAMCEVEGISICKSPICDDCTDYHICFGPEE